jgi:hypothetical protein
MMKRILSIIGFTAVAVVFALAQITVDGNPSEWTGTPPTDVNTWKYSAGTAGGLNEWIWKDAQGDERTDFASPDTRVDILEVRIASDANYLYFLIKMRDIDVTSGYEAPMVQISIDRDLTAGSGVEWLGGWSDTQVNTNARWEYLVTTRFGSGNTNLRVWNTSWSASYVGSAAISATNDVIEGAIPWSAIGGSPNNYTLRFTFSTYRANTSDDTRDIGGPGTSNALDVVTTAGPNTWDEVSDGVIDYYVDIQFLNDQTLPVQAVSLVAITGNSKVTLVWETGSEFNNAGFEIYRKAQDENDFKYIAGYQTNPELRGLGTSSHGKRYTYTDENVKGGATYVYKIYAVDFNGNRQEFGSITANVVAEIPNKYVLYQNYPNPFNPGTEIRFDLPKSGNVKLEIFNSLGERVAVLYDGFMEAGYGKVVRWNASGFPSGVYYYRLTADGFVDVKKMVLMK